MNNFEHFTEMVLNNVSYIAGAIKAHLEPYKELEELAEMYIMADYFSSRAVDLYCAFPERHEEVYFCQEVNAFKEAFVKYLDSYKESKYRIHEIEFRERNPEF